MAVAVNEKLVTGAIAIMAVVGAFVVVQAIRSPSTPASPPASRHVRTAETIVSDYPSTRGFTPFVYRNEGATGWYTMLDIVPEAGPFVRWVDVSMVKNYQGGIAFASYTDQRTNCQTWQVQLLRIGFPADMISPAPNQEWFAPEAGTQGIEGSYEACKRAGKLS